MRSRPVSDKLFALGRQNQCSGALLEVTGRCNATCRYCFVRNDNAKDLSTQEIGTIIDKLADHGIMRLTISGGEPFLRTDILDIFQHAIDREIWNIVVFTNGTLLTSDHLSFIKTNKTSFAEIQFSVFSNDARINDAYFGVTGALAKTMQAARAVREIGIDTVFALNIVEETIHTAKATADYLNSEGFAASLSIDVIPGADSRISQQSDRDYIDRMQTGDYYKKVMDAMGEEGAEALRSHYRTPPHKDAPLDEISPCYGLITDFAIDYTGTIFPCNSMRNTPIGSMFDPRPVTEILNASSILTRLKSLSLADITPCSKCRLSTACTHCPVEMMVWTGTPDTSPDHRCNKARALLAGSGRSIPDFSNPGNDAE